MATLFKVVFWGLAAFGGLLIMKGLIFGLPNTGTKSAAGAGQIETAALPPELTIGAVCERGGNCVSPLTRIVSRAEWGDAWTFPTDRAVLVCVRELGPMGHIVVVDGKPYAVTGATRRYADVHGLTVEVDGTAKPVREYDGALGFLPGIRLNEMGCG